MYYYFFIILNFIYIIIIIIIIFFFGGGGGGTQGHTHFSPLPESQIHANHLLRVRHEITCKILLTCLLTHNANLYFESIMYVCTHAIVNSNILKPLVDSQTASKWSVIRLYITHFAAVCKSTNGFKMVLYRRRIRP